MDGELPVLLESTKRKFARTACTPPAGRVYVTEKVLRPLRLGVYVPRYVQDGLSTLAEQGVNEDE